MKKLQTVIFLMLMLAFPSLLYAQESQEEQPTDTGVYVTTQDFSSLRIGPGTSFERLLVVPPVVTVMAVGRTADFNWIQVNYEGETGWIHKNLLVWSGDISILPVDNIEVRFVRRTGVIGITTRATPIYRREVTPSDQVGIIPPGERVELTARLGSRGFFQFQIIYQGELYWVGSWNIRLEDPGYLRLLDTSYLYPYGRLAGQLDRDIGNSINRLAQIEDIWLRLQTGQGVSCGFIPTYAERDATDTDVTREQVFKPLVVTLDSANAHINLAISSFADACGRSEDQFFITQQEASAALVEIDDARRELVIAISLLTSLQVRDPLLDNSQGN
jgi:uncharacterized protein YraI